MRVLFVAHSFPRAVGDPPGSFILRLARGLLTLGIEVAAVVPHAAGLDDESCIDGVPVHRYRYAPGARETLAYTGTMAEQVKGSVGGKLALASLLASGAVATAARARRWRPDLVHAHWWFPGGASAAAAVAPSPLPLVTTSHGSDVRLVDAMPGGRRMLAAVVRRSARFTAVSTWLAEQIRAAVPGSEPIVAPMPANVELFAPSPDARRDRLLFVGRLNTQKGLAFLLQALAKTKRPVPLDVVAEGPDATELRALADGLGLGARVSWLGNRPAAELAALYQRAAAVVMPSVGEGLGMVAVEAQLTETPVVAFASGGLTDVVVDGRTGLLVPPGDVPALTAALDRVLADGRLASALGAAGRTAALERFTPVAAAERYAAIYEAAIGHYRP